jgi:hypothetical protein
MKKLTTQDAVYGPYRTIEVMADRYRCDGADLPFNVIGEGVISDVEEGDFPPPPPPPPTDEQRKLTGIEILNVMCSATSQDQSGLTAVALGVTLARMNGQTFPDTRFEFENGNSLVVTDSNFDEIYAIWTPFRQSFFVPDND